MALGERIGTLLRPGDLVTLTGPLGAGKTVLVRGMAVGAGVDPALVRSPTFVLHHVYRGRRLTLHHLDLYRLGAGADLSFMDIEGLLAGGAVVVEWGELGDLERLRPLAMTLEVTADDTRRISCAGGAGHLAQAWQASSLQ
jgi:tRNA threonylcarbamoyladenosine biosynthesis protein TsaE